MFTHVMVGARDLEASRRFYDAVLGALGHGPGTRNVAASGHVRWWWREGGVAFAITEPLDGAPVSVANGGTIGFRCSTEESVRDFVAAATAHGGVVIEDPPGWREGSSGRMYIAYVRDPDGHKLCALYRPG